MKTVLTAAHESNHGHQVEVEGKKEYAFQDEVVPWMLEEVMASEVNSGPNYRTKTPKEITGLLRGYREHVDMDSRNYKFQNGAKEILERLVKASKSDANKEKYVKSQAQITEKQRWLRYPENHRHKGTLVKRNGKKVLDYYKVLNYPQGIENVRSKFTNMVKEIDTMEELKNVMYDKTKAKE